MIKRAKELISYFYLITLEQDKGEEVPYVEVRIKNGKYLLDGYEVNNSFGSLYDIFDNAFKHFDLLNREIKTALILGFGAGSVANIITNKYNDNCKITGVDKDGKILEYAHKYFKLHEYKNLILIKDDAIDFAQKYSGKFDLIVVDLFVENRVPVWAKELDFLISLKKLMHSNSIIFFNKITHSLETKAEANKLLNKMEKAFGTIIEHKQINNNVENRMFVHNSC